MQLEAAEREIEDGDAGDLGGDVGAAGKVFGGAVPDDIAPVQADAHSELVVLARREEVVRHSRNSTRLCSPDRDART